MTSKYSIFSFFSGIGILDLGFEDEGFKIVYANEISKSFIFGYEHSRKILKKDFARFGHETCSIDDLFTSKKIKQFQEQIKILRGEGELVGFIGGPPCPDFSVGGKNRGKDGENGRLSLSYVELICKLKPDFFVFENVKGLTRTKKHKDFYEALKIKLSKNGYLLADSVMNAIEFGVAQDRDRIFLIGANKKSFSDDSIKNFNNIDMRIFAKYPHRTAFTNYFWEGKNNKTSAEPPDDLTVKYWFDKNSVEIHPNAKDYFQPRAGLAKFLIIQEGDDSKKSYKRLHRKRYSPTAAYGNNEVHIHPIEPRRLSAAEVMSIQSLPKKFSLPASMTLTDMFKSLGNGVPYLLARGIAKTVKQYIKN
jgi:DNA (cytosine-5)-methyltransferase 1